MKLRVRLNRQTSRVELDGEEPTLKELIDHIRDSLLSTHGLSSDTEFSLSLNGSELLTDSGQTLASCGIVSGDLVCVVLPPSAASAIATSSSTTSTSTSTSTSSSTSSISSSTDQTRSRPGASTNQPSSSSSSSLSPGPGPGPGPGPTLDPVDPSDPLAPVDPSAPGPPGPVWEPMLCDEAEEGEAPLSLELLYHSAQISSPSDAVVTAGHLLMLETGFVPEGCGLKPDQMPAGWKSASGVYRLQYSHPLCGGSVVSVVAVCMGPMLVNNMTLKVRDSVSTVCKLSLNPSEYTTLHWNGQSAAAAFRRLRKLSRLFKDQLAYPLISAAREAMSLPVAFGLPVLPPELLLRVLRLLDVQSVVRLSSVSRVLHAATADSSLWRHLYRRDFRDPDGSRSRDTDWKELYKTRFKSRSSLRRASRLHPPPLPHLHPRGGFGPISSIPPPLPPGIIGGEYDQRPNLPFGLLPLPRYDPIGPPPALPDRRPRRDLFRPADVRRGFI